MLESTLSDQKRSGSIEKNNTTGILTCIGDICFWLGLSLEILMLILDKSSYIVVHLVLWYRIGFILLGIKFVLARPNKKELLAIILMGALGLISKYTTNREDILRAVMIIGASSKMDLKKVMKVTFWETLVGCVVIVLLAFCGIGGAIKATEIYRGGGIPETRYMFGMGHPGACHCMVLMLLLLWTYVYYENSKWWQHLIGLGLNALAYYFTDCNQAFLVGLVVTVAAILMKYCSWFQKNWFYVLGICIWAVCVLFSVFAAKVGVSIPIMRTIDHFVLNGRLQWGETYGKIAYWSAFGKEAYQEFFDMGWIRLFYWYGVVPAICYLVGVVVMFLEIMKKKDAPALIIMTALSLYTLFEAHIMSQMVGRNYMLIFMGFYVFGMLHEKKGDIY